MSYAKMTELSYKIFQVANFPYRIGDHIYDKDNNAYGVITSFGVDEKSYFSIHYRRDDTGENTLTSLPNIFSFKEDYDKLNEWYAKQPGSMIPEYYFGLVYKPENIPYHTQVFSRACLSTLVRDMFGCHYDRELPEMPSNRSFHTFDEILSIMDKHNMPTAIIYVEELLTGRIVRAEITNPKNSYDLPAAYSTDPIYPIVYNSISYLTENNITKRCSDRWIARARPKEKDIFLKPFGQELRGQWKRTSVSYSLFCSVCGAIKFNGLETPHCPNCNSLMNESEIRFIEE